MPLSNAISLKNSLLFTAGAVASIAGAHGVAHADSIKVQAGDTLTSLAKVHNTTVDALVQANNISNPNLIFVDQALNLPGTTAPAANVQTTTATPTSTGTYTVAKGDTLWQIAINHNMSVFDLAKNNNLDVSQFIHPGQTLLVGAASQAQTQTTAPTDTSSQTASQAPESQVSSQAATQQDTSSATATATSDASTSTADTTTAVPANPATTAPQNQAQQIQYSQAVAQPTAQPTQNTQSSVAASGDWLTVAKSLIGTPYVWGGKSPATGLDCSGFVAYVLNHSGRTTNFPSYTVAEESQVQQIPVSQAQPGDLLFWGQHGATYHVAIYLGNNQFIAAPQEGDHVRIQNLSSGWMPSFAGRV